MRAVQRFGLALMVVAAPVAVVASPDTPAKTPAEVVSAVYRVEGMT